MFSKHFIGKKLSYIETDYTSELNWMVKKCSIVYHFRVEKTWNISTQN